MVSEGTLKNFKYKWCKSRGKSTCIFYHKVKGGGSAEAAVVKKMNQIPQEDQFGCSLDYI